MREDGAIGTVWFWRALVLLLVLSVPVSAQVPNGPPAPQTFGGTSISGRITLGSTSMALGQTYTTLTGVTFGWSLGTWSTQSGTTYTLQSNDCGTGIRFTSNSAVTVTIPNSLSAGCDIKIAQFGTAKVSVNGSAVPAATLRSPHSYTGTFAQYSVIQVDVDANPGGSSADALFEGDGS